MHVACVRLDARLPRTSSSEVSDLNPDVPEEGISGPSSPNSMIMIISRYIYTLARWVPTSSMCENPRRLSPKESVPDFSDSIVI